MTTASTNHRRPPVLIIRNAAATDFGGAETYPVSLSESLLKEGTYHPIIVTASTRLLSYAKSHDIDTKKGPWLSFQNWTGWRTLFLPIFIFWQCFLIAWYILLIKKVRPQALHIQSRDDFIAGSIAGHLTKTQVVWTDHMDLRYVFLNIKRPLRNTAGRIVLWATRFANHIIIISHNEYRLINELLPVAGLLDPKISLIKNGVIDQLATVRSSTPTPRVSSASFHFCLASRLVINKGVGDAIAAFQLLLSDLPDNQASRVHLDIYGSGADEQTFKQQASTVSNIHFHGHTNTPLQAIYASNAFILPSYQEGFSIALLEATMLGRAIIATGVDSNPEIITDRETGLLVPARNPKVLSEAMKFLLENPTILASLEKNARKNYLDHYNLETIVQKQVIPLYTTS